MTSHIHRRPPLTFPTPAYVPNRAIDSVRQQNLKTPYGKLMPASEVRPLGLPDEDWLKEKSRNAQKVVDSDTQLEVDCQKLAIKPSKTQEQHMTFTRKGYSKNGKQAFYSGGLFVLRFLVKGFVGGSAPEGFEVADGIFEPAKQPKAKLTAEERKAVNAAKPKLTLAEKAAAAQKRADALKAKADAANAM